VTEHDRASAFPIHRTASVETDSTQRAILSTLNFLSYENRTRCPAAPFLFAAFVALQLAVLCGFVRYFFRETWNAHLASGAGAAVLTCLVCNRAGVDSARPASSWSREDRLRERATAGTCTCGAARRECVATRASSSLVSAAATESTVRQVSSHQTNRTPDSWRKAVGTMNTYTHVLPALQGRRQEDERHSRRRGRITSPGAPGTGTPQSGRSGRLKFRTAFDVRLTLRVTDS
jgi:hypothetical protein